LDSGLQLGTSSSGSVVVPSFESDPGISVEDTALCKKCRLLKIFHDDRKDNSQSTSDLDSEVFRYLSRKMFQETELVDPLLFWKDKQAELPRLAQLARKYLGICPSSVPVENMFSINNRLVAEQ